MDQILTKISEMNSDDEAHILMRILKSFSKYNEFTLKLDARTHTPHTLYITLNIILVVLIFE